MTETTEVKMAASEMWDAAKAHGNRYLLPRRLSKPGTDPEKDLLYDAAEWLVTEGFATWLSPARKMDAV